MSLNITERQLSQQYENYAIDADKLSQRMQDREKGGAKSANCDTVEISADGRSALESRLAASVSARRGIQVSGTLTSADSLSYVEDYEKAVSAQKRDKVVNGNFDRHVDKMVSAYQQMRHDIEEKYANMGSGQQEQLYYTTDDQGIQKLARERELELLDYAYEQHSKLIAGLTESLNDLQDFKPQIIYYGAGNSGREQPAQSQPASAGDEKKAGVREQAYQAFLSAIQKGSSTHPRNELNRVWDYYAN